VGCVCVVIQFYHHLELKWLIRVSDHSLDQPPSSSEIQGGRSVKWISAWFLHSHQVSAAEGFKDVNDIPCWVTLRLVHGVSSEGTTNETPSSTHYILVNQLAGVIHSPDLSSVLFHHAIGHWIMNTAWMRLLMLCYWDGCDSRLLHPCLRCATRQDLCICAIISETATEHRSAGCLNYRLIAT